MPFRIKTFSVTTHASRVSDKTPGEIALAELEGEVNKFLIEKGPAVEKIMFSTNPHFVDYTRFSVCIVYHDGSNTRDKKDDTGLVSLFG